MLCVGMHGVTLRVTERGSITGWIATLTVATMSICVVD